MADPHPIIFRVLSCMSPGPASRVEPATHTPETHKARSRGGKTQTVPHSDNTWFWNFYVRNMPAKRVHCHTFAHLHGDRGNWQPARSFLLLDVRACSFVFSRLYFLHTLHFLRPHWHADSCQVQFGQIVRELFLILIYKCHVSRSQVVVGVFCLSHIGVLSQPFATHTDSSVCYAFAR